MTERVAGSDSIAIMAACEWLAASPGHHQVSENGCLIRIRFERKPVGQTVEVLIKSASLTVHGHQEMPACRWTWT